MMDLNVENIVVSTQLAKEFDLKQLANSISDAKYNPEEFPGLVINFDIPKTAALIFSSGKVVCTGIKRIQEVNTAINMVSKKIKCVGVSVYDNPVVDTQNIVASTDFNKDLQLNVIANELIQENVEYEPEQFPGLIYKMRDVGVELLLFSSGKLVCTGAKKIEDVSTAIETMKDNLTSLGVL